MFWTRAATAKRWDQWLYWKLALEVQWVVEVTPGLTTQLLIIARAAGSPDLRAKKYNGSSVGMASSYDKRGRVSVDLIGRIPRARSR